MTHITHIRHHAWIIALVAMSPAVGYAQSETEAEKVNERLVKIEQQLTQQTSTISSLQSTISSLRSEIEAVTKQNLALKSNLNLKPTIAQSNTGDGMEYRVVEVTGDKSTNRVHIVITSNNTRTADRSIHYKAMEVVDDLGNGFDKRGMRNIEIEGVTDDLIHQMVDYHPNVPYTIHVYLNDYKPESQYVKYLAFDLFEAPKHFQAKFENLPIKWADPSN